MADEVNENIFLVNAPAGSGKTTWIRQQVESYLLRNPKDNILCITYTNRAAEELGRDLEQSRVYFGTIHSFINDFIGSFFSHKEIIDLYWEVYETQIIERIKNTEQKETWTEGAERYKEKYGSLDLDTVRSNINKISYNETPFNSLLYGGLGHNDLITFTKLAVDRFPIIKKKISDKYQLIFIDEYQDTSAEVLHIFYTSLVGKKSKLYLLGDKMQQIYKNYNGEFEEKLETFNRSVNLSINYRTTPKIVDILNYIYNDEALKQCPYEKNSNDTMAFSPKVLIVSDDSFKYIRNSKSYFDEIPNRGHKLFIKKNRPSPWINGYDCVMEQIELLSERLEVDGEHLEKRVADYCDKIPDTVQLIKLGRKWRGCRVVCENPNRSFLRVLYKDWYNHKFDWEETELGRIVLSASEPYCLLITPQLWTYNNGYLLNPPESFISSSSVEQKKQIHDILFEGVDDTETVLAGGIIDYTHKEEIFGFMVSYFSIPGLPSKYAAHCYERNSRLLLQSRPDFSEQEHYNITLHHNGIESFQGSNIMCGFSKISLDEFHWHINITVNGMRLFNEGGQEIGRFEYYYGQRGNMGNRYISNQPLLQRWVVSKDAISKARCIVGCPNNIKINHAFDSVIRKYED